MTDGETETVVSASLQKIKSIKNPIFYLIFYLIKSETSDSFVNHFDGHFSYLKTLDFYFNEFRTSRDPLGQALKAGKQTNVGSIPVRRDLALSSKAVVYGYCLNCYFVPPRGE